MPRAIDLFIDSDQPLDRLAGELGELSGLRFVPSPGRNRFTTSDGDVVAFLSAHDFIDDEGLPLSEFRYVLSTTVPYGVDVETSAEVASLRRFSSAMRERGGPPCLLVIDLERADSVPGREA